jgi:hypothetical protein
MQRVPRFALVLGIPILAVLVATAGCGKEKDKDGKVASDGGGEKEKPGKAGEAEAVAAKGTGSLKGKVTYDGDPPKLPPFTERDDFQKHDDKAFCLMGSMANPTWTVSPDKGVANVVVWLRAPKNHYFNIPDDLKKPKEVSIDQPHCAFEPHVVAIFPSYYDPKTKKQLKTDQVFKVLNSAPINHNTKWEGSNTTLNPGGNETLKSKKAMDIDAKPCDTKKFGGEEQLTFHCDIHKWMTAYARVFDHPYAAVTGKDGSYEIPQVPAGAEVEIVYWHEDLGKPVAEKLTLKEGSNTRDFKIKK